MTRPHLYMIGLLLLCCGPLAAPAAAAAAPDPFADNACVQCHRDLPGRSSEIVDLEWKQSVHYAAKVACEGCHGGDASVRREQFATGDEFKRAAHLERIPEFLLSHRSAEFVSAARGRSVSYLCGKCHSKIKEQHLGSPHGEFGDPTCIYCHGDNGSSTGSVAPGSGSHRIHPASIDIIDARGRADAGKCSPCHRAATMESVTRIKQLLSDTEARIKSSGDQYRQLETWGYRNLELERLHHHAAEVRSQLRQIFHSFNMREIGNFAAEIQGVADRTGVSFALVQRLQDTQQNQTVMGCIAILVLLSFAALLVYYKHAFLAHGRASAHMPVPGRTESSSGKGLSRREAIMVSDKERQPQPQPTQGPQAAQTPDERSFARLVMGLALLHFYGAILYFFISGAIGTSGEESSAADLISRALIPIGRSSLDAANSGVSWLIWFANSALWGLALATLVRAIEWGRARIWAR